MTSRDQKFIEQGGVSVVENKIFSYIDSDWRPISLLNPLYKDIFVENGTVKFTVDSSFDAIKDAMVPVINLVSQDNAGNPISWTSSRSIANGPAIIKVIGAPPLLTIVPFKNNGDDTRSDKITLTAKVNNALPNLGYDSWDPVLYENSVRIDLLYGFSSISIDYINTLKGYQLIDIGSPAVEYVSKLPFTLPAGFEGFDWSNNGDNLFVLSNSFDRIYQYPVSINYDVTSVTNTPITFDTYKYQGTDLSDIKLSNNGERMYILDRGNKKVRQYNLSVPYDVSSSKFVESSHQADEFSSVGFVKSDGTGNYSLQNNIVYQWDLNTAYNISSSTYNPTGSASVPSYNSSYISNGYITTGGGFPFYNSNPGYRGFWQTIWEHVAPQRGLCFSNDGKYLYTASGISIFNGEIERRSLSTPWNITTAVQDQRILHEIGVATASNYERNYKDNELSAIRISNDGTKFFILDKNTASVYQYNLPAPYSINSLSPTIKPVPKGAYDGGYDYVYPLSQIPNPRSSDPYVSINFINGLEFNESGSRMYVSNGAAIYEYNLVIPFSLENVQYIGTRDTSDLIPGKPTTLSGGSGGGSNTTTYTTSDNIVVTSSEPTYPNTAYNIQFMFNNTPSGQYWLTNGGNSGSLTFNFTGSDIEFISHFIIYPRARDDTFSNITSIQRSSNGINWTTVFGNQNLSIGNTGYGVGYTYDLSTNEKYIRINLQRSGNWGLSLNEIQVFGGPTKSNDSISKRNEKFYVHIPNTVYEFNIDSSLQTLSIPYNTKSFGIDRDLSPTSIDMNDSGTRMYIGGSASDNIHQYELSDPYEIYSASYIKSFDTPSDITNLQAISVQENSEKMFGVNTNGFVYEFDMDIANLDSSQYNSVFFQPTGNNTAVTGMRFNRTGDFFYLGGNSGIDAYRTKNNFRVKPL